MNFQQQRDAFKKRLASQPIIKRNIVKPSLNQTHDTQKVQKKIVFELPVAGTKQRNIGQQMFEVIAYLKTVDNPQTAEDLKKNIRVDIYSSEDLYRNLTNNSKITFDPENNTFAYKPVYNIKNKEDLLALVREHKAMDVKELKDSYSNLFQAIKELGEEGKILIIYTKETIPRIIYANDTSLNVETDEVFKELWHSLSVPAAEDLSKELEKAGLKSMEVFETKTNHKNKMKKKSRQRNRKVKITNTHLEGIDLTKDYVVEKK